MKRLNYILFASLILFLGCEKDDSDEVETVVYNSAVNPVAHLLHLNKDKI